FMLYDSIILYFRVIYSNLFKNDVEVLEGAGVLVKSFPAGGFHDFNRIAFAKTHDPHTGPVTLDRIFTAFKNPFDKLPGIRTGLVSPRQETFRTPTVNRLVFIRHMFFQGGVSFEWVIISRMGSYSFAADVYLDGFGSCTHRTRAVYIGI